MQRQLELELLRRAMELREERATSFADDIHREPTVNYTASDRFILERDAIFRGVPQIAGLSCDLPLTGSYFTVAIADVPVLVVRGEDGFVRAYLNMCRHRGSPVAADRGNPGRVFKCPYHAWSYDINGKLLGQPSAGDAFANVDAACTGLMTFPAEESAGIIYVRPVAGGEPIDVEKELVGLAPSLAGVGFDDYVLFTERHGTWNMNWKQPFDSFLEAYHIFSLHKESLSKETLSTPMLVDNFGRHARGVVLQREAISLLDKPEDEWVLRNNANVFFALFPNTILNLPAPGHVELWQFYPDGVDKTRVHVRFYTPGEPHSDRQRAFYEKMVDFTMSFVAEDFEQQEKIFANLTAAVMPELIYGRNEPALINFHQAIETALQA